MFDIFISYRRGDSRADAGRVYDRLSHHFGPDRVFMDVDDIDPGQDFARALRKALENCGALVVLVGPDWADFKDGQGRRKLEQPNDFVRLEVVTALDRGVTLLPVLVGGAGIPEPGDVPAELAPLFRHQAIEISDGRFHADVDRLIEALESAGAEPVRPARRSTLRRLGFAAIAVAAVALGLYFGAASIRTGREVRARVAAHIDGGDRFAADEAYDPAIAEYRRALDADTEHTGALRRLVSATTQKLLLQAFGHGGFPDVGLRGDYEGFAAIPDSAIEGAYALVHRLLILDAGLQGDPGLLLEEALLLKTSGPRVAEAIPLLEAALAASPDTPQVLAELGLIKAVVRHDPEGIDLIRSAATVDPNEAR